MADHSKPTTTSLYTDVLTELDGRLDDIAKGLDPANTSPTNVPTNSIRWSSASNKWEKWNGSAWSDLSSGFAININGTVGAGTPAAGAFTTISASGVATFSAGTVSAPSLTTSGDTNTGVFFPAADTIAFAEGGVEAMRITSSGNVGIGTDTPAAKLEISSANGGVTDPLLANTRLRFTDVDTTKAINQVTGGIEWYTADTDSAGVYAYISSATNNAGSGYVTFATGSSSTIAERMRIDSSGNLLIGATAAFNTVPTLNKGVYLLSSTNNDVIGYTLRVDDGANARRGSLFLDDANGTFGLNATATSGVPEITFTLGGTECMRIDSSGNVGIGTSSPGSNLHINSTSAAYLRITGGTTSTTGIIFGDSADQNTGYFYYDHAADSLAIAANNAERMRITSAGEVLVGGTTVLPEPYSGGGAPKLNVEGTGGAYLALFRNDTSVSSPNPIGDISFYGNDTTSNTPTRLAYIAATASGTHAAGDNPTDLVFGCTNDGSETAAEFARLGQDGASGRKFEIQQATLANSAGVYFKASGGTAGTNNRFGQLGVYKHSGITNSVGFLSVTAEDGADNYLWADNSDVLRISTTISNIGTTGGTVVGTQTSDERIKNIIGPVTYGLEQIKSINPVEYTLKDDVEQTKRIGFIAQQVQPIVPESVYDTKEVIVEGEHTKLGMEYVSLIPVLVNAVKELSAEVEALKAQLKGN